MQAPEQVTVLSNTYGGNGAPGAAGTKVWTFEPTPPMSPYLLAIAAGSLKQLATATGGAGGAGGAGAGRRLAQAPGQPGAVTYGFWAVPGLESQLELAAELAPKAFAFYSEYFAMAGKLLAQKGQEIQVRSLSGRQPGGDGAWVGVVGGGGMRLQPRSGTQHTACCC